MSTPKKSATKSVKPVVKKKAVSRIEIYDRQQLTVMQKIVQENEDLKKVLSQTNDRYEAVKERLSELNNGYPVQEDKVQTEYARPVDPKGPLASETADSFSVELKTAEDLIASIESKVHYLYNFPPVDQSKGPEKSGREDFFYGLECRIYILGGLNNRLRHILSHFQKII